MVAGKPVEYVDSIGVKHVVQEYGSNIVTLFMGGQSVDFSTEEVYIDGRQWAGFHDIGIGNPVEQAKGWIEEQIKARTPPPP